MRIDLPLRRSDSAPDRTDTPSSGSRRTWRCTRGPRARRTSWSGAGWAFWAAWACWCWWRSWGGTCAGRPPSPSTQSWTSCPGRCGACPWSKEYVWYVEYNPKTMRHILLRYPTLLGTGRRAQLCSKMQCFGTVFTLYGSGSSILGCIPIRIRIQSRPDPRFWWPKIRKNLLLKKM